MSDWIQISCTLPSDLVEQASTLLEEAGASAVTCTNASSEHVLEPAPGQVAYWRSNLVTALFDKEIPVPDRIHALTEMFQDTLHFVPEFHWMELEDQVWERAWMDHYHAQRFGKRLQIGPAGERQEDGNNYVVLDPGLAFGTGSHPTTAMCLEVLDQYIKGGEKVLDYGCGSGILAIAAIKLGADHCWAIDYDEQALLATRENAQINGVQDHISIQLPGNELTFKGDVVVANILANTIVSLSRTLLHSLRDGGLLILSGILSEQAEMVKTAFGENIEWNVPCEREQWVCLSGIKTR